MLIWVFGVGAGLVPDAWASSRRGRSSLTGLQHLALPAITLGACYVGLIATVTRASLIEVLAQPYMAAARARGEPSGASSGCTACATS